MELPLVVLQVVLLEEELGALGVGAQQLLLDHGVLVRFVPLQLLHRLEGFVAQLALERLDVVLLVLVQVHLLIMFNVCNQSF